MRGPAHRGGKAAVSSAARVTGAFASPLAAAPHHKRRERIDKVHTTSWVGEGQGARVHFLPAADPGSVDQLHCADPGGPPHGGPPLPPHRSVPHNGELRVI